MRKERLEPTTSGNYDYQKNEKKRDNKKQNKD